jgi:hypothetical protein
MISMSNNCKRCEQHVHFWPFAIFRLLICFAGPIAAISVLVLPPFMASPMEPDPATMLQSWAGLRGIGFDLMTYAELLSSPAGNRASGRSRTGQGGSAGCHAEAVAMAGLEQMLTNLEGVA